MSSPPPYTSPWPPGAFLSDPGRSQSSSSLPESEDGGEKDVKRQHFTSEAAGGLHTAEAVYWDNAVIRSYLLDAEYSDSRGPLFMARPVAAQRHPVPPCGLTSPLCLFAAHP